MPAPQRSMSSQLESTSAIVSHRVLLINPIEYHPMKAKPQSQSVTSEGTMEFPMLMRQLGEYMLKGWTLTDLQCDTCHVTPLMREPAAQASGAGRSRIQFCAFCDGGPDGQSSAVPLADVGQRSSTPPEAIRGQGNDEQFSTPLTGGQAAADFQSPLDPLPPISSARNSASTASTSRSIPFGAGAPSAPPSRALPPAPISPANATSIAPATTTGTTTSSAFSSSSNTRIRSSDEISELISQRLLQGFSLLQSNCPNSSCRGVPLIGFPRAKDGSRDPRRMCVSCGTGYVTEGATGGMTMPSQGQRNSTPNSRSEAISAASAAEAEAPGPSRLSTNRPDRQEAITQPESPRSKRRRELYETGEAINSMRSEVGSEGAAAAASTRARAGSAEAREEDEELEKLAGGSLPTRSGSATEKTTNTPPSVTSALNKTSAALAITLDRLAESLSTHTAGKDQAGEARYFVDVKLHTEAMRDVLEVLERIRKVQ